MLRRAGIGDVVVLERADEVGGTWRDNTYPGCACDVPSALYSFSFAPNPDWGRLYAGQPEIREYARRIAREHGADEHVVTGADVLDVRWDDDAQRWRIETTRGSWSARAVISATGPGASPCCRTCRASTRSRARSSTPRAGATTTRSPASASR